MPASQASQQWVLHHRKQAGCLCTKTKKILICLNWFFFFNFNLLYRKPAVTEQYYFVNATEKENLSMCWMCVWKKECYMLCSDSHKTFHLPPTLASPPVCTAPGQHHKGFKSGSSGPGNTLMPTTPPHLMGRACSADPCWWRDPNCFKQQRVASGCHSEH